MSGDEMVVPIEWLIAVTVFLGSALILSFVWWVKREFKKNDFEHDRTYKSITAIHAKLDAWILGKVYPGSNPGDNDGP